MAYEKHTTHTDALDTLGSVITSDEKRDAIHLAVFPVEAATRAMPGDHVSLNADGKAERAALGQGVGIVDPFLTDFIQPGDWFWLVVYPRQISSLRHVWEHPSFPPSQETEHREIIQPDPELDALIAEEDQIQAERRAAAAKWIKNWLSGQDLPYSYNQLIQALTTGSSQPDEEDDPDDYYYHGTLYYDQSDGSLYSGGVDAYGTLSDEFWDNAEIVVGKPLRRSDYFSCSC